jgi:ferric enterobactin receptor
MRKFSVKIITLLFFLLPLLSNGQTVTGKVVDEKDGKPLEGATVSVKGKTAATKTDTKGEFSIAAVKGDVLLVTSINFENKQSRVKDGGALYISLAKTEKNLDEVVVTAMGISRTKRSLGTPAQSVKGEDLAESQRENVLTSLAGRVAGVDITTTSGQPGASVGIIIRGAVSMDGNNQPLIVIDGLQVDNSTFSQGNLFSDGPNRNNDYTNRLADLSPSDIENITVLKGPEAAALYGNRGASGALVITTRRAKAGKTSVTYDYTIRGEKITRFPEIQTTFGGGTGNVTGLTGNLSRVFFGERYPAGTKLYDNIGAFFKTGITQKHNLGVEAGTDKLSYRLSVNVINQEGIVPKTGYDRYSFRLSSSATISPKLDILSTFNFVNAKTIKAAKGQFGFLQSLLTWPSIEDVTDYLNTDGTRNKIDDGTNPTTASAALGEVDNPFWDVNKNLNQDVTNRFVGNTTITLKPFKGLLLKTTIGIDRYNTTGFTLTHPQSRNGLTPKGILETFTEDSKLLAGQFTAIATKKWGKINNQLAVGFAFDQTDYEVNSTYGTTFYLQDYNSINNTDPVTQRSKSVLNRTRNVGWFGQLETGYNNMAYLTLSSRYDGASTLVAPGLELEDRVKNAYFLYSSISMSFIYTELFKSRGVLNYGKLRFSYGNTGKTTKTPYVTASRFGPQVTTGGGFALGAFGGNNLLTPEFSYNLEVGTEMKFFNDKIGLDFTYFNTRSESQIVAPRLSYGTGNPLKYINGGTVSNQGIDITLTATPIKRKNFSWDVTVNFDKIKNEILEMPADLPIFYISDYDLLPIAGVKAFYTKGSSLYKLGVEPSGATSFLRNNTGQIIINPGTGLPVRDTLATALGDRIPEFRMGLVQKFKYKNFSLSINFDIRKGGDVFNGNELILSTVGLSKRTLDRETPRVIQGVLNDAFVNTANPTPNTISVTPAYQNGYYNNIYNIEDYVEKNISWIRLRDVTLAYNLTPFLKSKQKFVKGGSVFVTATDVFMITNYTGADPNVSGLNASVGGAGAIGYDYGALALPIGINAGIKVNF